MSSVTLREVLGFVGSCVLARRLGGRAGISGIGIGGGAASGLLRRALCTSNSSNSSGHSGSGSNTVTRTESVAPSTHKKSPIYTRTGDKGTSMLYNGERRPKADRVFEALGHQDELNVVVGIAREHCAQHADLVEMLTEIQSRVFDLGAATATPANRSSESKKEYTKFPGEHTLRLEAWIDRLDAQLEPLKNFILPSGGLGCTHLHLARAVCRRAERAVSDLVIDGEVDPEVGVYINRLSDFLFVAARTAAKYDNKNEIIWKK